jgi:hypothetical protein
MCVVSVTFQISSRRKIVNMNGKSWVLNKYLKKKKTYRYIEDSDLARRGKATAINTSSRHATKCSSSFVSMCNKNVTEIVTACFNIKQLIKFTSSLYF